MTPQQVDDELGRLASTRGARVLGWCSVVGWCVYLGTQLFPPLLA